MVITPIQSRADFLADPESDAQPWNRIAKDGNTLRYRRMRSEESRSWCTIDQHDKFVRRTQGASFAGHFTDAGDVLICTVNRPGLPFRLNFDHPITGLGLDIEPDPLAVVPGQVFRVGIEFRNLTTGETAALSKDGVIGAPLFMGGRSAGNDIDEIEMTVTLIDAAGLAVPVDYALNRLELLVPVGLIV
jgi:hypothetical protein